MEEISDIRKLQLLELNILKEVAAVCDRHHLTYYLSEGTLLGAVRHQGFIPWDDDVDVCMPREDYEVFATIARTELPEYMDIEHFRNSDDAVKDRSYFIHPFDRRYKVMWKMECDKYERVFPVSIDVFPLDGLPSNQLLQEVQLMRMLLLYKLTRCSTVTQVSTDRRLPVWKRSAIFLARLMQLDRLNTKKCYGIFDDAAQKYAFKGADSAINFASEYGKRAIAPTTWFGEGRMVQFEDAEFRIPNEAEKILAREYGDYLTPPLESERKPKHVILMRNWGGVVTLQTRENRAIVFAFAKWHSEKEACAA